MISKTQLTADDIKSVINMKSKEKGIEVTHIAIEDTISFIGDIKGKLNSKFNGKINIKDADSQRIILEIKELKLDSLGLFKGATNMFMKTIIKISGENYVRMKGNCIVIYLGEMMRENLPVEFTIENVYIMDKLINIEGKNFKNNMFKEFMK